MPVRCFGATGLIVRVLFSPGAVSQTFQAGIDAPLIGHA
jgi:hypothetical protein